MLSTYYKNRFIDAICGNQTLNINGSLYLGLATAEPTETLSSGVPTAINTHELAIDSAQTGSCYQRVLVGNYNQSLTRKMAPAANGETENTAQILFNRAGTNWATGATKITHVVFFASATGTGLSDVYGWAELETPVEVAAGYVANFALGAIQLSIIDAETAPL